MVLADRRHRRRRRLRPRGPVLLGSLVALVVLGALVGGMVRTGSQSTSYWRSVDRSYAVGAKPLVEQSNHLGARLETLLTHLGADTRVTAEIALRSLARAGDRLAREAVTLSQPPVSGGAGQQVATAMADRAQAIRGLRAAVDGLLGLSPAHDGRPGTPTASLSAAETHRSLARSGSLIAAGDRAYASARHALRAGPGHASLPASAWRPRTRALSASRIPTLVSALAGSTTLAPVHDVVLATGALALTPAPVPPTGSTPSAVAVVPPTGSLTLHAVVANQGNVAERGIVLRAVLRTTGAASGARRSARSRGFAVDAHGSMAVTVRHLHVVPGTAYTLTVRVDPASTDAAGAHTSATLAFEIAPPSPPAIAQISPSHGRAAGGTGVTIFGSGFEWVRSVKFGTNPARYRVVSSTQITAVAPPGTGKVAVTVENTGGASATVTADRFAYRKR